jgi:hypothetical protein
MQINYQKLDMIIGFSIVIANIPLNILISVWFIPICIIGGVNLEVGNFRRFYDKRRLAKAELKARRIRETKLFSGTRWELPEMCVNQKESLENKTK